MMSFFFSNSRTLSKGSPLTRLTAGSAGKGMNSSTLVSRSGLQLRGRDEYLLFLVVEYDGLL